MEPEATVLSPSSSIDSDSLPPSPPPLCLTASSVTPSAAAAPLPNPRDLHLTPCTWDILRELPREPRLEVVDGIFIFRPDMGAGSHRHQSITSQLTNYLPVVLRNCTVASCNDVESAPIDSATSSPPTRRRRRHSNESIAQSNGGDNTRQDDRHESINIRVPDVFIMRGNTSSSSTPPHSKKPVAAKLGDCLVAIEVTSRSTRKEDMETKWLQYARSDIDIYIIIDIAPLRGYRGIPTVIVGSLTPSPGARCAPTGYPGNYPSSPQPRQRAPLYYKREYNDDEVIVLPSSLNINWPGDSITPRLLGDDKAMYRLAQEKHAENDLERQRRLEAERERSEERRARLEAERERSEEKTGRLEERRARLEAERERSEEKRRRLEERKRRLALEEEIRRLKGGDRDAGGSDSAAPENVTTSNSGTTMVLRSRRRRQQRR